MMSLKLQGFNGTKGEKGNQGIPGTVFGKYTLYNICMAHKMYTVIFVQRLKGHKA